MGLKYELTEAPSAELAPLYKESNGKYILDVDDAVSTSKLSEAEAKVTEFRANNVALKQQLETVTKTSLKDVKPNEINVEKILEDHVSAMKENYETQVGTLSAELAQQKAHLERVVLADSVNTAASEYGVLPSALPDVLSRAKEAFEVKDGQAVPKDKKLDKDGKAYTIHSWITSLNESAPHLFAQSRGSGSQTSVKGKPLQGDMSPMDKIAAGLRQRNK